MALAMRFHYIERTAAYYRHANRERFQLYLSVEERGISNGIVFFQFSGDFAPEWCARNEPDLTGNIFIPDAGPSNGALAAEFPGRTSYLYHFDSKALRFVLDEQRFAPPASSPRASPPRRL